MNPVGKLLNTNLNFLFKKTNSDICEEIMFLRNIVNFLNLLCKRIIFKPFIFILRINLNYSFGEN